MNYITNEWVTLFIPALDRSFWCGQMLLQLPEGQVQRGVWGKSSRYFTVQTNAMFTGLFLQMNVEDLNYGLMPPARLKYFSDKNNNNKLSSTQKINCVQQGDRRVHSSHCTTGLHRKGQTGKTPTSGHGAQGLPEGSEHVPLSPGRWQPWLCHPQGWASVLLTCVWSSVSWSVSSCPLGHCYQRPPGQVL